MSEEIPGSGGIAANRRLWDSWTRMHRDSSFYDVAGFLAGRDPLNRIETQELGDVWGKRFLHLQCHFGIDTLGWARRGAVVTGVDFSPEAVTTARELASEAGLEATFIESDIYTLDAHDLGEFDIVHTSYGVLPWLPDLDAWARIVERVGAMEEGPLPEYNWPHGIGEVVTVLVGAGLRMEWLREHARTPYPFPEFLEERPDGEYGWPDGRDDVPLLFSIGASHA